MASSDHILIVEDNDDDVVLIRRAFRQCKLTNPLHFLTDGERAIAYLAGEGSYADRSASPVPVLVLLDLKLPRKSGLQVLEWMKQRALLKRIPVVILTSSKEHKDVSRAYDLGVNSYLTKPVEYADLRAIVERLHLYWILTNESPDITLT